MIEIPNIKFCPKIESFRPKLNHFIHLSKNKKERLHSILLAAMGQLKHASDATITQNIVSIISVFVYFYLLGHTSANWKLIACVYELYTVLIWSPKKSLCIPAGGFVLLWILAFKHLNYSFFITIYIFIWRMLFWRYHGERENSHTGLEARSTQR